MPRAGVMFDKEVYGLVFQPDGSFSISDPKYPIMPDGGRTKQRMEDDDASGTLPKMETADL